SKLPGIPFLEVPRIPFLAIGLVVISDSPFGGCCLPAVFDRLIEISLLYADISEGGAGICLPVAISGGHLNFQGLSAFLPGFFVSFQSMEGSPKEASGLPFPEELTGHPIGCDRFLIELYLIIVHPESPSETSHICFGICRRLPIVDIVGPSEFLHREVESLL